ncbi:hypothetical protein MMPV_009923 [Pyropia vietnamensis]
MGSSAAAPLLPVSQGGGAWAGQVGSPPAGDGRPRARRHPPAGGDGAAVGGGGGGGGGGGSGGRRLRGATLSVASRPWSWVVAAVVGLTTLAAGATLVRHHRAAWRYDGDERGGVGGDGDGTGSDGTAAALLAAIGPPAFSTADVVRLAGPPPTPPPTTWDNPWANVSAAAARDTIPPPDGRRRAATVGADGRPRVWALGTAAVVTRRRSVLGCGGTYRRAAVEGNLATLRYLARAADGADVDGTTTATEAVAARSGGRDGGDTAAAATAGTVDVFVRGAGAAATAAAAAAAAAGEVGPLFGASLLGACAGEVLTLSLLPHAERERRARLSASAASGSAHPVLGLTSDGGGSGVGDDGGGGGDSRHGGDRESAAAGIGSTVHMLRGGGKASSDPFAAVHFAVALMALAPGRSSGAGTAAMVAAAAAEAAADAAADALASRLVVVAGAKGADCITTCATAPEGGRGGVDGVGGTTTPPRLSCADAGFRLVNNCPALRAHFDCRSCELAAAGTAGRDMPCWVVPTAPVGHPRGYCMVHPQGGSACDAKYQHTRRLCPCVPQGVEATVTEGERGRVAVGEGTGTLPA